MAIDVDILSQPPMQVVISTGLATGSSTEITYGITATQDVLITAAQALGLYRAVTIDGFYADTTTPASLNKYAGITTTALSLGEEKYVVKAGLMTEAGWTWTPDAPIFIGTNGTLTQTPVSGPMRRIGWAISATQINLDPFPTIKGA